MIISPPLVSVLIPCYNVEDFVQEAIKSITNQTYQNLEIIVINDGSKDNTKHILQQLASQDKRITYIENPKNIGLIQTLNKGLKSCTGKYIARMDSDDISLPQRIEQQVDFLEKNPDIGIIGSYIQKFGEKKDTWRMEIENDLIKSSLFYSTCFAHPSVMFRNEIIAKYNLHYDEDYPHAEDYKLWYDFSKVTQMANLPKILLKYRINKGQVSQKYNIIQHQNTIRIRKTIINNFCTQHSINLNLEEKITLEHIKNVKNYSKNTTPSQIKYLLLVLYASNTTSILKKSLYLFFSLDFIRLGAKNTIRIIYWGLFNKNKKLFGL